MAIRKSLNIGASDRNSADQLTDAASRQLKHPHIVQRDSPAGRRAYVQGSRLAVWQVVSLVRAFDGDVETVAEDYRLSPELVQAALDYAHDFADEIQAAIDDNASYTADRMAELLPNFSVFVASGSPPGLNDSEQPSGAADPH